MGTEPTSSPRAPLRTTWQPLAGTGTGQSSIRINVLKAETKTLPWHLFLSQPELPERHANYPAGCAPAFVCLPLLVCFGVLFC